MAADKKNTETLSSTTYLGVLPVPIVNQNRPVLHVLAPGQEGGLERVVAMMAVGQRERGAHVAAVLTPTEAVGHPFLARLDALGVAFTPVVVGARSYLREYRSLGRLVDRLRPSVIHTHGYRADVIAGAIARAHRTPTVSTVHGFTGGGRNARFYERVQSFALRHADAVIAVSRTLVDDLVRVGVPRARVHLVQNGYIPPEKILARSDARNRLGVRADAVVVGWVGRLSSEKGLDVMLSAIAECDPSWNLSVIGDGPEKDRIRAQAEALGITNRVAWHGLIPNAGSLLAAFDAYVLSSRTEGTPIALFEAMHAGVPIVATSVGGVPDVVGPAEALLVPPDHPQMIAQALEDIAARPSAAAARSRLARDRLNFFNSAAWLAAVDTVYDGVGANRPHLPLRLKWESRPEIHP